MKFSRWQSGAGKKTQVVPPPDCQVFKLLYFFYTTQQSEGPSAWKMWKWLRCKQARGKIRGLRPQAGGQVIHYLACCAPRIPKPFFLMKLTMCMPVSKIQSEFKSWSHEKDSVGGIKKTTSEADVALPINCFTQWHVCQHILAWGDANFLPPKNAVFRCFFGLNKFSRPNGRLSPIACHTYLESYGT